MTPRILVISGSRRAQSFNMRVARLGAHAIEKAGGKALLLNFDEYPLPMYDGDLELESGIPEPALALKRLFKQHHGFFIASPEYNASVSPLLKNAIDWVSRATPNEHGKVPYKGKVAALASATASAFAGARGMAHLRQILTALGTWVVPDQLGIPDAPGAFGSDGSLRNPVHQGALEALAAILVATAAQIAVATEPQA